MRRAKVRRLQEEISDSAWHYTAGLGLLKHDPLRPCIDVELVTTQEANERHAEAFGEINSQTARRGNGAEHRHAGRRTFLGNLEAGAATHHHDLIVKWKLSLKERPADQLVDRVMASDILAQREELTLRCKETGGMESACRIEDALSVAQLFRETV